MNPDQFHKWLEHPTAMADDDIAALQQLVIDEPWNSAAQILLAIGLNKKQISGFDAQLHKASVYAGSRTHLFRLISQPEPAVIHPEKDPEQAAVEQLVEEDTLVEAIPDEVIGGEISTDEPPKQDVPELDTITEQVVIDAVSRSIEQEVLEDVGTEPEREETEGLSNFSSWLLQRSETIGYETSFAAPVGDPADEGDLIDRFIKKDPKIRRKEIDEVKNNELARQSVQEDESLVTETMARIYEQQGKIDRAKRAYELLSLKYPEKSVYFADRIKRLSKK